MTVKHAFASAKSDGADATQVQPSNWNADHVIDSGGATMATSTTIPATPSAGNVVLFGKTIAGGALPAYVGPAGVASALQPFFGRNKVSMWIPSGNSSGAVTAFGIVVPSNQGNPIARNVATTNMLTAARRSGGTSSATAGNFTGFRAGAFQFFRSTAAGLGGFRFVARWGCSDAATVAGASSFVGMASASVGAVNPSSMTNIIGVGTDSGDTVLQLITNDGTGTATKTSLGANFPDHTLSADLYELALFCAPNSTSVGWELTRLNTGDTASGTVTTDLPAVNTLLGPQLMRQNGATALAVGLDMVSMYIETDN